MTASQYAQIILGNCQLLVPQPTRMEPRSGPLGGIRAVLLDIYGTLLISASGDIGASAGDHRSQAIEETCKLFALDLSCAGQSAIEDLDAEIARAHGMARQQRTEFPEVDIVEIWQAVLPRIAGPETQRVDWRRFALEYEVRVNPVWPMPGVETVLSRLAASELVLGIVSNAQFFTPLLFPAFFGKTLEQLGFDADLSYFSYEHRQAKPGRHLYRLAARELAAKGIQPEEVLYVGNDLLKDVAPAHAVGFRTALFAGDGRSLRLRSDDDRVQGLVPDRVITDLLQLLECLAV